MSIVIVGGNDRMATRYQDVCKSFKIKSKVFTQMPSDFENKLGTQVNTNVEVSKLGQRQHSKL